MKRQLFCLLSLAFVITASGQSTTPETPSVKTDYLKKSKNQKTAAWVLLGAGSGIVIAGTIIASKEVAEDIASIFTFEEPESSNTGGTLMIIGAVTMAGSIPLLLASAKNKRNAQNISASFKLESRYFIQQYSIGRVAFPALSFKVRF